jgi:riboflavin kinase/FMN adenylyltransferase
LEECTGSARQFFPNIELKPILLPQRKINFVTVHHGLEQLPQFKLPVLTIGSFDGVHMGHRSILKRMQRLAHDVGGETIVITFDPHPRTVISFSSEPFQVLQTLEEKTAQLAALGMDHLVVVPFTKSFAAMEADQYIRDFLVKHFNPAHLVIGYDHHFGKNRSGNIILLKESQTTYGFQLHEIPAHEIDQTTISSTKIRTHLRLGEIERANAYLCSPYTLSGKVIEGKRLGRTLGFPTANIQLPPDSKIIPKQGVYAVWVNFNGERKQGMLNLGTNPTVDLSGALHMEVHLFSFEGDLYDQVIEVEFHYRLRDELKFNSIDELKQQLEQDQEQALAILTASKK